MLKQSDRELIPLFDGMKQIDLYIKEYDIFLTPKYYVVKREKLPIKFTFQAKKLAPSILDDLIESDKRVEYVVYKDGEEWVFIAYEPELIISDIEKAKLDINGIRSIYFAEQLRDRLEKAICLGDDLALSVIDGYVTQIPKALISKQGCNRVNNKSLKANKAYASLSSANSSLSNKQTYILAGAISLIAILTFAEGMRYKSAVSAEQVKVENAADGDSILMSEITRSNILNKYKKIDIRERNIRNTIKKVASLLDRFTELESFKSNEKGYSAVLKSNNIADMGNVMKKAKREGLKFKKRSNKLIIEGEWK